MPTVEEKLTLSAHIRQHANDGMLIAMQQLPPDNRVGVGSLVVAAMATGLTPILEKSLGVMTKDGTRMFIRHRHAEAITCRASEEKARSEKSSYGNDAFLPWPMGAVM